MEFYQIKADLLPMIRFVDDTIIEPPYVHRKRKAGEYIMYFIKRGEMYLKEDGAPLTLKEGDVCILDKDRTHEGVAASVCEYFYVHFMHPEIALMEEEDAVAIEKMLGQRIRALKSDIFEYDECRPGAVYLPKHWHVDKISTWIRLEEFLQKAKQENYSPLENYKVMCACQIQQFLMEYARAYLTAEKEKYVPSQPEYHYRVQEILEWLNREYGSEITGERMEDELGGNFDYMNRIFKRMTGQTIFQYLTNIRVNHAKMLILHTSMKISMVGKRVGFPDQYYFSRVFKKVVGIPPAEYAKTYQAQNGIKE